MNPLTTPDNSGRARARPFALTVEGWRGINHSYALVNQFQLLEMVRQPGLDLRHIDRPFSFGHWSRATTGAGLLAADEAALSAIPTEPFADGGDAIYRIFSPIDLSPPTGGQPLVVFAVTEMGLDADCFTPGYDIRAFEAAGGQVVTPSQWSRARVIDHGFLPETVRVVPHAASPRYFHPLPAAVRQAQRQALGFRDDEVVLLNIGLAIWNKGIDVLLTAFARARQQRKDLRLLFKDQRNTYGIAGDRYVQSTLQARGLWSDDVAGAITLIPSNLNMEQMNSLYGVADCYVSPYRAEGFNLPVCEAMACGTPVIVTGGGATDDFVGEGPHQHRLHSTLHERVTLPNGHIGSYREPDGDQLVQLLAGLGPRPAPGEPVVRPDWEAPTLQLLRCLGY